MGSDKSAVHIFFKYRFVDRWLHGWMKIVAHLTGVQGRTKVGRIVLYMKNGQMFFLKCLSSLPQFSSASGLFRSVP